MGRKIQKMMAGAALLGVLPVAALAADGSFDRKLGVKGPVLLSVVTGAGSIHVQAGAANEVHVVAHVHASGGSADDRVKQVVANPPIVQTGNIISIGKKMQVQNVAVDYEITTPRGTDLRAESGSGDIRITDNGGPVQAHTGAGKIDASGLSDHVNLQTGTGDIKASMLSSLDVRAQTGSGSIQLKNVQGPLWAETGTGDVNVSGRPAGGWKLETGSGNVTLDVGGAAYALDAETGTGDIETGAAVNSSGSDKHHVVGNVGGGGAKVRIHTGTGDIKIQ
jgi:DUF4097 and DUF4098 domain-containing protein YvlB